MTDRSQLLRNLGILAVMALVAVLKWDWFKSILVFVFTLGVLVAIHEWGHYIAAKSVGARVFEFAIGMGPKLITYMRRHDTEYTIRALPIGGFVNIKGMQPDDEITEDGLNGKRPAERALVYLAGPLMNVIFGVTVILLMGALVGTPDNSMVLVADVQAKSAAAAARVISINGNPVADAKPGLRVGDRILSVNGVTIKEQAQIFDLINPNIEKPITLTVQRRGDVVELSGTTRKREITGEFPTVVSVPQGTALDLKPGDIVNRINGKTPESYAPDATTLPEAIRVALEKEAGKSVTVMVWRNGNEPVEVVGVGGPVDVAMRNGKRVIGIFLGSNPVGGQGPRESLDKSVKRGAIGLQNFFAALGGMASKPKVLTENVGGPVKIFEVLAHSMELPPYLYLSQLASLSLSLAVFNLIPIPVLDGGHMLILTVEVLRRKRLSPDSQRMALMVGLAIIGVIFVLINYKDISRFF